MASGLGAVGGTETVVRVPALLGACPLARDRGVVSVERYEEVGRVGSVNRSVGRLLAQLGRVGAA